MQKSRELELLTQLLAEDEAVLLAIVFGSIAKESQTRDSDLDIAVLSSKPLTSLKKLKLSGSLAQALGRPVDLVDLQTVGEPLLGQILQYGKRIKGRDSDFAAIALKNVYANEDFLPLIKRSLKERRERWIK